MGRAGILFVWEKGCKLSASINNHPIGFLDATKTTASTYCYQRRSKRYVCNVKDQAQRQRNNSGMFCSTALQSVNSLEEIGQLEIQQ